jgi:hypothetical protein
MGRYRCTGLHLYDYIGSDETYDYRQRLANEGTIDAIIKSAQSGATEYSCSNLGIPGLRHFVYKSRTHVQVTAPFFEEPYDDIHERRRFVLISLHTARKTY